MLTFIARFLAYALATFALTANAYTTVSFESLAAKKTVTVTGSLYEPEGAGPFPAVVLVHGCNGIGQNVLN